MCLSLLIPHTLSDAFTMLLRTPCMLPKQVTVGNQGPYDFMVDSGLTGELITPHLQRTLGISKGSSSVSGLGAGGAVQAGEMVELRGAALYGGKFAQQGARAMLLPPLNAVVTPFPQVNRGMATCSATKTASGAEVFMVSHRSFVITSASTCCVLTGGKHSGVFRTVSVYLQISSEGRARCIDCCC
jgi:hypothetical protein